MKIKSGEKKFTSDYEKKALELFQQRPADSESEQSESVADRRERLVRQLESTVAREGVRNKRSENVKEVQVKNTKDWENRIKKTVAMVIDRCTPSSRVTNIPVYKLDVALSKEK